MPGENAKSLTYASLKRKALAWPEVRESTSYGTPALKVRDRLMARLLEDNRTVVLRTTWEERERLMVTYPEVFFITEHYRKHAWVLLSLPASTGALAAEAVALAWRLSAPKSLVARLAPSSTP
jgi:hypothetical protein